MPATSWTHRVGQFTFQFWEGEIPESPTQQVETLQRAGVTGTGFRVLGVRGDPFEATLTEHFPSYAAARPWIEQYKTLIGQQALEVWKDGRRLLIDLKTKFVVLDVRELSCQAHVRLMGPGYQYAGGAALVSRWKLLPVAV